MNDNSALRALMRGISDEWNVVSSIQHKVPDSNSALIRSKRGFLLTGIWFRHKVPGQISTFTS
jgi:hypothetical protein